MRYGEGIWLMDFRYLYEIEQRDLLQLLKEGQGGEVDGERW
jgi:hypothetical protein